MDQPGGVEADGYPQKHSPEHPGESQLPPAQRSATTKQSSTRQRDRQPVPNSEPLVETVMLQVGRIVGEHGGLAVKRAMQYPAHVRPPSAIAWRVRVARLIRVLMVHSMHGHPVDRTALERHRATDRHGILKPLGRGKTSVGKLAVITDSNAHVLPEDPHHSKHNA